MKIWIKFLFFQLQYKWLMTSNDQLEHKYGKAGFEMNGNSILMVCISRSMISFGTHGLIDKRYLPISIK